MTTTPLIQREPKCLQPLEESNYNIGFGRRWCSVVDGDIAASNNDLVFVHLTHGLPPLETNFTQPRYTTSSARLAVNGGERSEKHEYLSAPILQHLHHGRW